MVCFTCKTVFDDRKCVIKCTACRNNFHGKCKDIDLRGFHMKKAIWRCKICTGSLGEVTKPERSRKRSRVEEAYIDQDTVHAMNVTLEILMKNTNLLNNKIDMLIEKNRLLKIEIENLKGLRS